METHHKIQINAKDTLSVHITLLKNKKISKQLKSNFPLLFVYVVVVIIYCPNKKQSFCLIKQ